MLTDISHSHCKLRINFGGREKNQVLFPLIQFLKCKPDITVISSTPQTIEIKV